MNNKPVSREMFESMYSKLSDRFKNTEDTLFENVDMLPYMEKGYLQFIQDTNVYDTFVEEASTYEKNKILQKYITENVFSDVYTEVYDNLLLESDILDLTFKQSYLAENTEEKLNVVYKGSDNHVIVKYDNILENGGLTEFYENSMLTSAASGIHSIGKMISSGAHNFPGLAIKGGVISAAYALGGALIASIPLAAYLGMMLLPSVRSAKIADDNVKKWIGLIGASIFTSFDSGTTNSGLGRAKRNIQIFDNLDLNPDIKKMFLQLANSGKSNKVSTSGNFIGKIIDDCVEGSNILDTSVISDNQRNYFFEKYNPKKTGMLKIIMSEFFSDSNSKDSVAEPIINFRKCLITKLLDMYKFLMIANISETKEYNKIIRIMDKGFNNDPIALLGFMPENNDQEKETKHKIITLIQLRFEFEKLSKELEKGSFKIDKEAGKFFSQKLKNIDTEVKEYLSRNQKKIETINETYKENQEKYIKGNRRPEKDMKRTYLGL